MRVTLAQLEARARRTIARLEHRVGPRMARREACELERAMALVRRDKRYSKSEIKARIRAGRGM